MNITSFDNNINYLTYRKIMLGFQNTGLFSIYEIVIAFIEKNFVFISNYHNTMSNFPDQTTKNIVIAFNVALKVVFLCLHYNFNISYFEFDTDYDTNEHCVVCVNQSIFKFANFKDFSSLTNGINTWQILIFSRLCLIHFIYMQMWMKKQV